MSLNSITLFFIISLFSIKAASQDILVMRNGDEIVVKVLEVSPETVKYKKWGNLDGPEYSEYKKNIFMIKFQNGTKDVFDSKPNNQTKVEPERPTTEESKKTEAIKSLEKHIMTIFQKQDYKALRLIEFKKTNGSLKNIFGTSVYEVEFDLTVQFISDAWMVGSAESVWLENLVTYSSKPQLDQYFGIYNAKFYRRGDVHVLGCYARMGDSDNGFQVSEYKIQKVKGIGNKSIIENYTSNATGNTNDGNAKTDDINNNRVSPNYNSFNGFFIYDSTGYYVKLQKVNFTGKYFSKPQFENKLLQILPSIKRISQPQKEIQDTLNLVVNLSVSVADEKSFNGNTSYFAYCNYQFILYSSKTKAAVWKNNYNKSNQGLLSKGFASPDDAVNDAIETSLNQYLNQFIIGNFPISGIITEVTEVSKKKDEAKFVRINVGSNFGILPNYEFIVPEFNDDFKKGNLLVKEVYENYSICKVLDNEEKLLELFNSRKPIKIITKYKP